MTDFEVMVLARSREMMIRMASASVTTNEEIERHAVAFALCSRILLTPERMESLDPDRGADIAFRMVKVAIAAAEAEMSKMLAATDPNRN